MKILNNLRKQLPSNAKLNPFEANRVKGGADKNNRDRPSSSKGNGNAYDHDKDKSNGNAYGHGG